MRAVERGGAGLQEARPCTCGLAHTVGKATLLALGASRYTVQPISEDRPLRAGTPRTGKPALQKAGQTPLASNQRIPMDNPTEG